MMFEYQSGCIRAGMIRKREPSDDWCRVERITPRMTSGIVMALTTFRAPVELEVLEDHRAELQREDALCRA